MTARRVPVRIAALVVAAATALALVVVGSVTPASASAYRYWSYWYSTTGSWSFSQVGATRRPPAGSVDGWRFAVSGTAGSVKPRAAPSFSSICARHAAAPTGQKLIGLVVDYGTVADAPPGQKPPRGVDTFCAQVPDNANSAQVLTQYASVRSESGLVCGIDGYPVGECGAIVRPPTPKPTPEPASHPPSATSPATRPATGVTSPTGAGATAATSPAATSLRPSGTADPRGSSTPTLPASDEPQPVAVGAAGVPDRGGSSGGPPAGALAGVALVLLVGGAAVLRAVRGARGRGPGAP